MNWIDYIFLAFVLYMAIKGFIIRFSGAILGSLATLIAWIAAFLLAAPVKNLLQSLFGVVSWLASLLSPAIPGTPLQGCSTVADALVKCGLPPWAKGMLGRVVDQGYVISTTGDLISYWVANTIIVVVVFMLLLMIIGFFTRMLVERTKLSLPQEGFIHDFDNLLGGATYALLAFFIGFGILAIFAALFPAGVADKSPVGTYVSQSFFGGLVYNNFLGIQTIYGSITRLVLGY
ncbi:MAG: hypothetical protein KBC08_03060 [Caldisericia bacterium]|nr:hypothetical protein [Caldisericia bacterium]